MTEEYSELEDESVKGESEAFEEDDRSLDYEDYSQDYADSKEKEPSLRRGKSGPRASSPASSQTGSARGRQGERGHRQDRRPHHGRERGGRRDHDREGRWEKDTGKKGDSSKKPRGNLPPAPVFDGDRKKDPKCFRKYANKVDSYVAIAEKIIDDSEIGLRLHAALEGEAADFLEDVPAKSFGQPEGWKVLLRVLKDKYDETRMSKVGGAMKGFFGMQLPTERDRPTTMRDIVDAMDRSARACRDAGLHIPDPVMIHFFFQHSGASSERQANLLLRTGGAYDWSAMKQAVELLYPNVTIRAAAHPDTRNRRPRGAHESQQTTDAWFDWAMPDAMDPAFPEWVEYHDPFEAVAEILEADTAALPEPLARELHSCFASHRENRQKLAKAVQARGYYVRSKGKGKSSSKGKGSSKGAGKGKGKKGGGKARGMSLEGLKKVTTCADCDQVGHWKGDPECPMRRANHAAKEEPLDEEDDEYGAEVYGEWEPEQWEVWFSENYGSKDDRSAHISERRKLDRQASLSQEAYDVAKNVANLRSRATGESSSSTGDNTRPTKSDLFIDANLDYVKKVISASPPLHSTVSAGPAALKAAQKAVTGDKTYEEVGSVWQLLNETTEKPDVDKLRVRQTYAVRVVRFDTHAESDDDAELIPDEQMCRLVHSLARRPATVKPDGLYLTIDTACENTVCGSFYMDKICVKLKELGLMPLQAPEREQYCFGPGQPQISKVRLSVPVGITGVPAIIRTSLIQEDTLKGGRGPNRIPFLAGQDWLHMMEAIIDLGKNVIRLPLLNAEVPIQIDHSGHLVICITDFPPSGWPPGLHTKLDKYPGAIFLTDRQEADEVLRSDGNYSQGTGHGHEFFGNHFIPNYQYEPNHDSMNTGILQGPCCVLSDYWQYDIPNGTIIRHHLRPRRQPFYPNEAHDRPDTDKLLDHRVTLRAGSDKPVLDDWRSGATHEVLGDAWTGMTCFFLEGSDLKAQLPPMPTFGVTVRFEGGSTAFVSPGSISPIQSSKKILKFDLNASSPLFEHASSVRQQRFVVPSGQFGSRHHADGTSPAIFDDKQMVVAGQADALRHPLHGTTSSTGGTSGRPQAPGSGSDGIRRGDLQGGPGHDAAGHDPESEEEDRHLPRPSGTMSARSRRLSEDRERPREISGVHGMRSGEEGTGRGVRGAHHRGEGDGLRSSSWSPRQTGRQGQRSQSGHSGIFARIGQLLFTLLAGTIGGSLQDREIFGAPDYGISEPDYGRGELDDGGFPELRLVRDSRSDGGRRQEDLKQPDQGTQWLRSGVKKRLRHRVRQALHMSKASREVISSRAASSRWPRNHFKYDLIEVFGGNSMISIRGVQTWGLKVVQPIDIRFGVDLRKRDARRWLLRRLDQLNPRLAIVEFPCTAWSILQRNVNYRDRPEELRQRQEADRPFLRLTNDVFESQVRRGGHALAENPASAMSHAQPEILDLRNRYYETTSDMCRFGMTGYGGRPLRKTVRWIATHQTFIRALDRHCQWDHEHEKVEGKNTGHSAVYPPALADAICKAYLDVVQEEDFGVHYDWDGYIPRGVHFVDVLRDTARWRPLFDLAAEILARKTQKDIFLDPTTDLYKKVQELVPWEIANVQISHLPKAKRVRPGLERIHRCSVLLQNDDALVIETEYLPDCQAPRERFITPVRYGICILGHAPGQPQSPSPAQPQPRQVIDPPPDGDVVVDHLEEGLRDQRLTRQDYGAGECWFPGAPLKAEQLKLAPSVVRLHRNLGHPRTEDFVRALLQHGRIDPECVALARRLRCATCERTKRPLPPRPTSLKTFGSFNDKLCMDYVFLHDVKGVKHNYLHLLEPAGGYNVFIWMPSRDPNTVLEAFTNSWATWAGYPRIIKLDQDGAFEGSFQDTVGKVSELDYSPAEAHWQAGEVEAFNRAFRYTAEKLIDEKQLQGTDEMKMLGILVGAAMNDKVRQSGASANMWVFGKSPQIPFDLLNTEGQIECLQGRNADEELRWRQQVRAQADVHINQFKIDDALRCAVNRKGTPVPTGL